MEGGSSSEKQNKVDKKKGLKLGSVLQPKLGHFVPQKGHDPRELRSWAKRTGFVSTFSGETERSVGGRRDFNEGRNTTAFGGDRVDLEKGVLERNNESISPKIEIDPILGRTRKRGVEIEPVPGSGNGRGNNNGVMGLRDGVVRDGNETRRNDNVVGETNLGTANFDRGDRVDGSGNGARHGNGQGVGTNVVAAEGTKEDGDLGRDVGANVYREGEDSGDGGGWHPSPKMICGLKDNPGYG